MTLRVWRLYSYFVHVPPLPPAFPPPPGLHLSLPLLLPLPPPPHLPLMYKSIDSAPSSIRSRDTLRTTYLVCSDSKCSHRVDNMTELNKGMFTKASKIFQRSEQERLREEEVIRYELRVLN